MYEGLIRPKYLCAPFFALCSDLGTSFFFPFSISASSLSYERRIGFCGVRPIRWRKPPMAVRPKRILSRSLIKSETICRVHKPLSTPYTEDHRWVPSVSPIQLQSHVNARPRSDLGFWVVHQHRIFVYPQPFVNSPATQSITTYEHTERFSIGHSLYG